MPYIGNQPGTGVRSRFIYTATASQTTFTGADNNSKTLKYSDADYIDVYLNGVCLVPVTDYAASTKTSVVLTQAASLSDTLEVVAYDIATISDTVSKADGGTFEANVTFADGADILTASKGTDNVRLGENAGNSIESGGTNNVVIGKNAGTAITTADHNTAVGHQAGEALTTGARSTLVGYASGGALIDPDRNVAFGYGSLQTDTKGSKSTAIGYSALNTQNFTSATDSHNTAVGYTAAESLTTGSNNTFVGSLAGDAITTSNSNTAVGKSALSSETSSNGNTAVGEAALGVQNVGGSGDARNTAVGLLAGAAVTTGTSNTFLGALAGDATDDGTGNTAVGYSALSSNCGDQNTALGFYAGLVITGAENTCVGHGAGESITSGSQNICIGHDAGSGQVTTTNDQLYIARTGGALGTDSCFLYGGSNGSLINGDNSSTFNTVSDERIKKNIVDSSKGLAEILQVKIRNFEYRTFDELDDDVKALNDGKGLNVLGKSGVKTGVIAQELETVFPNDVTDLPDGTKNVKIENTQWALIKAVQELSAKNDALEAQNTTQATQIADLITRVTALEAG
jgi:hypothetical protein